MMKKNSSPEIEMLLMAELISYPYHLGRVNLESLTSLIVSPHARKVLGVLVEMRKNDEEVTLVNVAYHLKDSDVTAILTKSPRTSPQMLPSISTSTISRNFAQSGSWRCWL